MSKRYSFTIVSIVILVSACQKIVQQRLSTSATCLTPTNSRPSTPNNHFHGNSSQITTTRHHLPLATVPTNNGFIPINQSPTGNHMSPSHNHTLSHKVQVQEIQN